LAQDDEGCTAAECRDDRDGCCVSRCDDSGDFLVVTPRESVSRRSFVEALERRYSHVREQF